MVQFHRSREYLSCPMGRTISANGHRLILLLFLISIISVQAIAAAPWAHVAPGLEYVHQRIGDAPWSIHVVKVSRQGAPFQLTTTLAHDHIYGLAPMSEQIEGLPAAQGVPVAAVNGDFFHIRSGPYQGDPLGLQIRQGELVSAPRGASFWVDQKGHPRIGQVQAKFRAKGPESVSIAFGLNERRADDAAVLYTPAVGESTRTTSGIEWILERGGDTPWLPLRPGESYEGKIAAVRHEGSTPLTPETMVLSIGPTLAQELPPIAPGAVVSLCLETSPDLTGVTTALAGGPILLENGVAPQWKPPLPRHPRTVLGWNAEWLFLVVVDGRQKQLSVGMNYPELTALMKRLGCTDAMNLDGGGSSTLWLGGQVMNSPSDGRERQVANGLIVLATDLGGDDATSQ